MSEDANGLRTLALIGGHATEGVFTASTDDIRFCRKFPGAPIAYWISQALRSILKTHQTSAETSRLASSECPQRTTIIHYWFEVSFGKILFDASLI